MTTVSHNEYTYLVNNVFWPRKLPSFGLKPEEAYPLEQTLLQSVRETATKFAVSPALKRAEMASQFSSIGKLLQHWEALGLPVAAEVCHQQLASLKPGDLLAGYLPAQNATLIINRENDDFFLSAFQTCRTTHEVMSSAKDLAAAFPSRTMRVSNIDLLQSRALADRIAQFSSDASDDIVPKSRKAGTANQEIRDVNNPKYIMDWLFAALNCNPEIPSDSFPVVTKKIRDDIQWHSALLPFRRSGMWMSIKGALAPSFAHVYGEKEGKVLYKAFMLQYYVGLCDMAIHHQLESEVRLQQIQKVARRMEKLEHLSIGMVGVADLVKQVIGNAAGTVRTVSERLRVDWNQIVEEDRSRSKAVIPPSLNFNADLVHCLKNATPHIKAASTEPVQTQKPAEFVPPMWKRFADSPNVSVVQQIWGDADIGGILHEVEIWVREQSENDLPDSAVDYYKLFEAYLQKAEGYYQGDPVGSSRLMLAAIDMVIILDKLAVHKHPFLRDHQTGLSNLDAGVLQKLLLPQEADLKHLLWVELYIRGRDGRASYESILDGMEDASGHSVACRYADSSDDMKKALAEIREDIAMKRKAKSDQLVRLTEKFNELKRAYNRMNCEYSWSEYYGEDVHKKGCKKCATKNQFNSLTISVYERSLPDDDHPANNVLFELRIPESLRALRDALYLLRNLTGAVKLKGSKLQGDWLSYQELGPWKNSGALCISLGSTTKLFTVTHYRQLHLNSLPTDSDVIRPNGYNITRISLTARDCASFETPTVNDSCTLKAEDQFRPLQWMIDSTSHTENEVLATQVNCPANIPLAEYKVFGYLRAEQRLQLRNIVRSYMTQGLPMKEQGVLALIQQALWESGTPADSKRVEVLRSRHRDLAEDSFVQTFIDELRSMLDGCRENWQEPNVLHGIINMQRVYLSPIGKLPDEVTHHRDYARTFGAAVLDVQPAEGAQGTYVTAYEHSGLSFYFRVDGKQVRIEAHRPSQMVKYVLIAHESFRGDMPTLLVDNYSHWLETTSSVIGFYPILFTAEGFLQPRGRHYLLSLATGSLIEEVANRTFVDFTGMTHQSLMKGALHRMELREFVHVLVDPIKEDLVVELPRFGLQFSYNEGRLRSREWANWTVDEDQSYGTLIGLKSGLRTGESPYQFEKRRETEFMSVMRVHSKNAARCIGRNWPTKAATDEDFASSWAIDIRSARVEVDGVLRQWWNNRELKHFVDSVLDISSRIASCEVRASASLPTLTDAAKLNNYSESITKVAYELDGKGISHADLRAAHEYYFHGARDKLGQFKCAVRSFSTDGEGTRGMPLLIDSKSCIGREFKKTLVRSWESYHQDTAQITTVDLPDNLEVYLQRCRLAFSAGAQKFWRLACLAFSPAGKDIVGKSLVEVGLGFRLNPSSILPYILQSSVDEHLKDIIGAVAVLWTCEQQAWRCLEHLKYSRTIPLRKELHGGIHTNWSPKEQPEWLLFELEFDLSIRPVQVDVAQRMMGRGQDGDTGGRNAVMQLNMGEGKTSVIIPMVVAALANGRKAVRVTVLTSLYGSNTEALAHKLGGLLGRMLYAFPCRRDMAVDGAAVTVMAEMYKECMANKGVIITVPEYRNSFLLKGVEICGGGDVALGRKLIRLQQWIDENVRDVLDESDEILHVKYQLIYTVGSQVPVHGGEMRWLLIETIMQICAAHAADLNKKYPSSLEYKSSATTSFPQITFLKADALDDLSGRIVQDVVAGKYQQLSLQRALTEAEERAFRQFVLNPTISKERDGGLDHCSSAQRFIGLQHHPHCLEQAMACQLRSASRGPSRAKDVAADRTEFGHPDMQIILTVLSYYQSGLSEDNLRKEVFVQLEQLENPDEEYESWITGLTDVDPSIRSFKQINLANQRQFTDYIYPNLHRNMRVIDFWLNTFVFPREAKLSEGKIGSNAWDLCGARRHTTTGFSGTDDTSLLLPLTIHQQNLPTLLGTNGGMISNLLEPENRQYHPLPQLGSGQLILEKMVADPKKPKVLLDVGALMLDLSNVEVGKQWLQLAPAGEVEAAVFFDPRNRLCVIDRNGRINLLSLSPFRERLDKCVVYLDDVHTRGTDLKLPSGTRAVVTLGKDLTKDKLVQACMRMRMLGHGHSVCFWASNEVDSTIQGRARGRQSATTSKEVLEWAIENTIRLVEEMFLYWGMQGLATATRSAARGKALKGDFDGDDSVVRRLGDKYTEPESSELGSCYGGARTLERIPAIVTSRLRSLMEGSTAPNLEELGTAVARRCEQYVPNVKMYAQMLGEEQERELEHEIEEERQIARPAPAIPYSPCLNRYLKHMITTGRPGPSGGDLLLLPSALRHISLSNAVQPNAWSQQLSVTSDFNNVIKRGRNETTDQFLRPVHWILALPTASKYVLISAYEANEVIRIMRTSASTVATLHMYTRQTRRDQKSLYNAFGLILPPSPSLSIPRNLTAQLAVFSGSLFFNTLEDESAYCNFLGFYPRPWIGVQQHSESGVIGSDGYTDSERRVELNGEIAQSKFVANPTELVVALINLHNSGVSSGRSHAISIVLRNRREFGGESELEADAMEVDE
ncbi:hypothetical protein HK097_010525 [Rhizophlyctis rosea]|uniref:ubiquitinyl hydrolase 1 n=1 Tax=Rhizophlyctis rosea TaxID=64517 RepID=A0AAD5X800_9FUNG|nr:hypothetical protein HK097_010525 [Rhizophlyctis rosea]